jgi:putative ABC transport system permease protein
MGAVTASTAARRKAGPAWMRPARMRPGDLIRVAGQGLRTRPLRAFGSVLGVVVGIAVMIGVVGVSASGRAGFDAMLHRIGVDLLVVSPGQTSGSASPTGASSGGAAASDDTGVMLGMIKRIGSVERIGKVERIGPVEAASATGVVTGATVYRTDRIPAAGVAGTNAGVAGTNAGTAVLAARTDLPAAVGAAVASGTWLNDATERYPAVVLGATAARRLGFAQVIPVTQVWLGGMWFSVVGILASVPAAPEIDGAALVGWPVAQRLLGFDGAPTTVYVRVRSADRPPEAVIDEVRTVLPATVNPQHPEQVRIRRPPGATAAGGPAAGAFTKLLLGLGGAALFVGGVSVANTMAASVFERRGEIGLRRALGATQGQIRLHFLTEAMLLSLLGGLAGVVAGISVAAGCAAVQGWPIVVPVPAAAGAVAAAALVGAAAGLYPALRAARLTAGEILTSSHR